MAYNDWFVSNCDEYQFVRVPYEGSIDFVIFDSTNEHIYISQNIDSIHTNTCIYLNESCYIINKQVRVYLGYQWTLIRPKSAQVQVQLSMIQCPTGPMERARPNFRAFAFQARQDLAVDRFLIYAYVCVLCKYIYTYICMKNVHNISCTNVFIWMGCQLALAFSSHARASCISYW